MLRLELLQVKGDLERELEGWVLDCQRCNRRVHWVAGIGIRPGLGTRRAGTGRPALIGPSPELPNPGMCSSD
jgi:hypothetical protein